MALLITDQCINCGMCLAECPNQAIVAGKEIYEINTSRCTECVGFYEQQTCVTLCPTACIIPSPKHQENHEQLLNRFHYLCLFG